MEKTNTEGESIIDSRKVNLLIRTDRDISKAFKLVEELRVGEIRKSIDKDNNSRNVNIEVTKKLNPPNWANKNLLYFKDNKARGRSRSKNKEKSTNSERTIFRFSMVISPEKGL